MTCQREGRDEPALLAKGLNTIIAIQYHEYKWPLERNDCGCDAVASYCGYT